MTTTTTRWLLTVGFVLAVVSGVVAYRAGGPYGERFRPDPRVAQVASEPAIETETLALDTTGDLRFDTWSHAVGDTVVRSEQDEDGDGRIDTWEYYRPDETLERFEKDTDGDGVADYRTSIAADGDRVMSLEYDANGDGRIDTWEYYRPDETLERFEKDTDGDGVADYRTSIAADGDRVVSLEYDANADGRIDTWEYYRPDETIERMEEDTDGDGRPDYRWLFSPEEAIVAEFSLDP